MSLNINLYDLKHFDNYDNFFTVLKKTKRYVGVYGHFYSFDNSFIYIDIVNGKENISKNKKIFYKCNISDLAKPTSDAISFYKFNKYDDLKYTLDILNNL